MKQLVFGVHLPVMGFNSNRQEGKEKKKSHSRVYNGIYEFRYVMEIFSMIY
jgi:hypothetical protein